MRAAAILVLVLLFTGCTETDVVTIHIRLDKGFAGTLTARSLLIPKEPGPLEGQAKGISWQSRANLYAVQGTFQNLGDVKIEDISFVIGTTGDGVSYVHATLPRGPDAKWPNLLLPGDAERQPAARAFEPDNNRSRAGSGVKLVLELQGKIIAHGYAPQVRGTKDEADDKRAILYLPAEGAREAGEPFTWMVNWK